MGGAELGPETSFINILFSFAPGETIPLVVARNGQVLELEVTLGERQS